jgi:aspartyl-tRNA(Asn)/glutamyl-tRNA(Gln) amidotransferase subunit A
MNLTRLSIAEAGALLAAGEVSAIELAEATFDRIRETEPDVHAYVRVFQDEAFAAAKASDASRARGVAGGPMDGIPIGVKDLFYATEGPTEAGSRVLEGHTGGFDATAVARLRAAGAVIVGKTVTHEFAYGMNVPPTRNPWSLDSYPGGSSAGSAVSVAVGSAFGAIGTDTAGSIRTPAAVNGIVGMKPTYGRVSRYGVFPSSPSLDHVGALTRTVEDCAIVLDTIAGHDPRDPASIDVPVPASRAALRLGVVGLRLGIDRHFFLYDKVEPGVREAAEASLGILASLGAEIVDVSIPELDWMVAVGSTIMIVDTSAWHRRMLRERGPLYERGTRIMLQLGELLPATAYANALRVRRVLVAAVRHAFQEHRLDALVGPTIPLTAPTIAEMTKEGGGADLSGLVHHNYPANVTGLPALSVPSGFSEGLPVGLQIVGRPFDEPMVLRIGYSYERATKWHERHPDLGAARDRAPSVTPNH